MLGHSHQRWQYPAKVEPLEPVAQSEIGWLVQHPDPVRRPPQVNVGGTVEPLEPVVLRMASTHTTQVMPRRVVQYQALFEAPRFAPDVITGWDVQSPVPVRRQRRPEGGIVGGFDPLVSFGWHVPQTNLVRRKRFINTGGLTFVPRPLVPFGWHVPQTHLVRRKKRTVELGGIFGGQRPVVPFGWHVPQTQLVRRKKRNTDLGGLTFVGKPVVPFAWYQQASEPVRREERVIEGGTSFVQAPRVVFEWYQQSAEVRRRPQRRPEGGNTFVEADQRVVFDWFQQSTDLRRVPQRRPEGGMTLGEPVTIDIDWLVQGPEPLPRAIRMQPEQMSTGYPDDVIASFGWYMQPIDPVRREVRPQGFITDLIRPPDVFPDSWFQQYPDQTRTRQRRPFGGDFRVEVVAPEVVTMDKWHVQHFNPMIRPTRPKTNVVFPVFPHPSIVPEGFEIRPCLFLSDIFFNSLLPLPSGYFVFIEQLVNSGYVAPLEELPAPSGWVRGSDPTPWNLAR